jgi:putative addiction module component (TIGR02574 family)
MKVQAKKLLEEAMKLPAEARAAIAGSLIDSLDTEVDEDAEAAWSVEIEKRLKELDNGAVRPIPWAKARKMILGRTNARV